MIFGILQQTSVGLLLLRLFLGGVMVYYGIVGLSGGPEAWRGVGGAMSLIGIDFMPVLWGFAAKATEALAGLLVLAGVFFRPALISLVFVMVMAIFFLLSADKDPRFPMAMGAIAVAMIFTGPGKIAPRLF